MNNSSNLFYHASHAMLRMGSKLMSNETDVEHPSSASDESNHYLIWGIASLLLLVGGACGYSHFLLARKKSVLDSYVDLDDAFSSCTEQMSNENFDVDRINKALRNHCQEATFFLAQKQKKHSAYVQPATEKTHLIDSKNQPDCNQGLNVLNELINTYPKYSFYDSYSIETLTLFSAARKDHHEHVLSVANAVLPDLRALLNEARVRDKTTLNMNIG